VAPSNSSGATTALASPKTTWSDKTQNIDGQSVIYSLGSGNPQPVALTENQYASKGIYQPGILYVSSETEKALILFLNDPFLPILLTKCKSIINSDPSGTIFDTSIFDFSIDSFSIENLLYIDKKTGRKEIRYIPMIGDMLSGFVGTSQRDGYWSQCLNVQEFEKLKVLEGEFSDLKVKYTHGFS
jgi:hypothetical protein